MNIILAFGLIALAIYLVLLPGIIAGNKGRSFWGYIFLGFIVTPFVAAIAAACSAPDHQSLDKQSSLNHAYAPGKKEAKAAEAARKADVYPYRWNE
jgi:hypothetical protein